MCERPLRRNEARVQPSRNSNGRRSSRHRPSSRKLHAKTRCNLVTEAHLPPKRPMRPSRVKHEIGRNRTRTRRAAVLSSAETKRKTTGLQLSALAEAFAYDRSRSMRVETADRSRPIQAPLPTSRSSTPKRKAPSGLPQSPCYDRSRNRSRSGHAPTNEHRPKPTPLRGLKEMASRALAPSGVSSARQSATRAPVV